ncbi:MAG: hypothetical protein AB1704_26015 [Pseudomonadota bacterium]|jgi:hypothetical protein|uniref:hypothetical protein n=1 Tax=Burkholderiaceae TaxID=119060 RepID=UPI0010F62532|nr:hypothetical protein [Burkholderia sp. 4M9327F10]
MNLQLATLWLERQHAGFSDLHHFAAQLRDAASASCRESAALLLLAERSVAFCDRHEGAAISTGVVDEFIAGLRADALILARAGETSDAVFLEALNAFAGKLAPALVV